MWAVVFTYRGDQPEEKELIAWEDALDDSTVSSIPGSGFMVVSHVDGPDPFKAGYVAHEHVSAVVQHMPVSYEIHTEENYLALAEEPTVPELVSAAEAAEILDVSRQRVHQLQADHDEFPAPLYELRTGPLWTRDAIEWFQRHWERKPGRRPRR